MMKKIFLIFFGVMLLGLQTMQAQIRGNSIQVVVVPDHQDWRYEVGETATFHVSVTNSNTLLNNIKVDYAAGPEMYQNVKKQGVVLKDGTLTLKGKMAKPGFYRVDVTAYVDGKEYPFENINKIDPKTIDRMDVLKDKEAVDKYGEKAKNGVILITTKQ